MSYDPTSIFLHCIKFTTDFISMGPSGFFVTHFNCNDNTFYEYGKWSSTLENGEFMTYITHFFHLKCWYINTFKVLYISNVGQIHKYSTPTSIWYHYIALIYNIFHRHIWVPLDSLLLILIVMTTQSMHMENDHLHLKWRIHDIYYYFPFNENTLLVPKAYPLSFFYFFVKLQELK